MKDFENFCEHMNIPLHVLPPRSPEMIGCVERANGTARDEFYVQYRGVFKLEPIREALAIFQDKYNSYRPHQALADRTPFEYTKEVFKYLVQYVLNEDNVLSVWADDDRLEVWLS